MKAKTSLSEYGHHYNTRNQGSQQLIDFKVLESSKKKTM